MKRKCSNNPDVACYAAFSGVQRGWGWGRKEQRPQASKVGGHPNSEISKMYML